MFTCLKIFRGVVSTRNASLKNFSQIKHVFNRLTVERPQKRLKSSVHGPSKSDEQDQKNALWYILSGFVLMIGASYAAVPLYKMFCESQGTDINTELKDMDVEKLKKKLTGMKPIEDRKIRVKFVASTSGDLLWKFEPCQDEIVVAPGETALAFFRAKNLTEKSIIGIATYTILPYDAGLYFNKIQCFCFEEQQLDPRDEVDMPVLFFIDEQFAQDPKLENVDQICLSYTFFESRGNDDLKSLEKLKALSDRSNNKQLT